jgi:hypothetical protein
VYAVGTLSADREEWEAQARRTSLGVRFATARLVPDRTPHAAPACEAACPSWPFRNLCPVREGVVSSGAMSAGAERLGDRECLVCRRPSGLKHYCRICEGLLGRSRKGQKPNMPARRDALHKQWNEDLQFTCKYTSVALTHNGGASNAEWEHRIPGSSRASCWSPLS